MRSLGHLPGLPSRVFVGVHRADKKAKTTPESEANSSAPPPRPAGQVATGWPFAQINSRSQHGEHASHSCAGESPNEERVPAAPRALERVDGDTRKGRKRVGANRSDEQRLGCRAFEPPAPLLQPGRRGHAESYLLREILCGSPRRRCKRDTETAGERQRLAHRSSRWRETHGLRSKSTRPRLFQRVPPITRNQSPIWLSAPWPSAPERTTIAQTRRRRTSHPTSCGRAP